MIQARTLIFDFECTSLNADFGNIICVGYKWLGEDEVHIIAASDPRDDKDVVEQFLDVWNQADIIVAYNGVRFDRPLFYAKLLEHSLEIPPNIPFVDPYFTAKSNLRISSKRLDTVARYLGCEAEKSAVSGRIWKKAMFGDAEALEYIYEHCIADVWVLEEVYVKLMPLMRQHPRVAGSDRGLCRFCGSADLERRGYARTALIERIKLRCKGCGRYDQRAMTATERKARTAWLEAVDQQERPDLTRP